MTRRVRSIPGEPMVEYIEWDESSQPSPFMRKQFSKIQDCVDWIENNRPGQVVEFNIA